MFFQKIQTIYSVLTEYVSKLHHPMSLIGRIYIANVFFSAGLQKIRDWDTTLFLFEEEYAVPFLSYKGAAVLGTGGELILPVLLVFGLGSRFAAAGLFFVNAVAIISLSEIPPAALYLHAIWALILAQLVVYGGGWFSADKLINYLHSRKPSKSAVLDKVELKVI